MRLRRMRTFSLLIPVGVMPIAAIACTGSNNRTDLNQVTVASIAGEQLAAEKMVVNEAKNTTIRVAVRVSDVAKYEAIADEFNKLNHGQVSVESLTELNMIDVLATQEAGDSLPNVFLVDMRTMGEIVAKSVFAKPILLSEIMGAENADLYNVTTDQPSWSTEDFNESQLAFSSNSHGVQYAIPVGYSAAALMLNTTMVDETKDIYSYMPIAPSTGINSEERMTGTKKLPQSHGKATLANIQKYIDQAGDSKNNDQANANWLGWGVGNMFQRIYSVARSTMKEPANATAMVWKELYKWFPLWATAHEGGMLNNNILNADNFIAKYYVDNQATDELVQYLWNAFGGYTYLTKNIAGFAPSDAINHTDNRGEVEPFLNKQSMFMVNAKWGLKMANTGWSNPIEEEIDKLGHVLKPSTTEFKNNEGLSSGQIKVLSLPYSPVGVADALAVSHSSSPVQSLVAKRFIKFVFNNDDKLQVKVAKTSTSEALVGSPAMIAAANFSSSVYRIVDLQKQNDQGQEGWYEGGKIHYPDPNDAAKTLVRSSDPYRQLNGTAWELTSDNFFTIVEQQIRPQMQSYFGVGDKQKPKWSYEQFKKLVSKAVSNFVEQYQLG